MSSDKGPVRILRRGGSAAPEGQLAHTPGKESPVKRALTFVVLAWFTAVVAVVAAGCQKKGTAGVAKNESVVDVGYAQQQPAQPVAQQPVMDDAFAPAQPSQTAEDRKSVV